MYTVHVHNYANIAIAFIRTVDVIHENPVLQREPAVASLMYRRPRGWVTRAISANRTYYSDKKLQAKLLLLTSARHKLVDDTRRLRRGSYVDPEKMMLY